MIIVEDLGGYFELELPAGKEYHNQALRFNTGRNALSYYLLKNKITDLWVPYYLSDNVLDSVKKGKTRLHFYHLDDKFNPLLDAQKAGDTPVLIVNYFGICEKSITTATKKFSKCICDNAQAFFSNPEAGTPTFYSPRKFFGVADGGYLYDENLETQNLVQDDSTQRYMARLVRIDGGAKAGNFLYRNTEQLLSRAKIRRMSSLTRKILSSIQYDKVWEVRQENFMYLHEALKEYNRLQIDLRAVHGPMVYPFLTNDDSLRSALVANNINVPQLWPEVAFRTERGSFEYDLAVFLTPLPIDQRYGKSEMDFIISQAKKALQKNKQFFVDTDLPQENTPNAEPIDI